MRREFMKLSRIGISFNSTIPSKMKPIATLFFNIVKEAIYVRS
jgi:hypothetical protein